MPGIAHPADWHHATAPVCRPHRAKQKTDEVQHQYSDPEFAQLANTIQGPLTTTAVISSAPAVISADGTTARPVVRGRLPEIQYILSLWQEGSSGPAKSAIQLQ
ncbi:PR domain zinc finger protein 10 isoform X1, partial [Lates japonicus]